MVKISHLTRNPLRVAYLFMTSKYGCRVQLATYTASYSFGLYLLFALLTLLYRCTSYSTIVSVTFSVFFLHWFLNVFMVW